MHGPLWQQSMGSEDFQVSAITQDYDPTEDTHRRGVDRPTSSQWLCLLGPAWDSLDNMFGSFLKDPWFVLGEVFPDFFNQNMIT